VPDPASSLALVGLGVDFDVIVVLLRPGTTNDKLRTWWPGPVRPGFAGPGRAVVLPPRGVSPHDAGRFRHYAADRRAEPCGTDCATG
jgi:hypothetical protein